MEKQSPKEKTAKPLFVKKKVKKTKRFKRNKQTIFKLFQQENSANSEVELQKDFLQNLNSFYNITKITKKKFFSTIKLNKYQNLDQKPFENLPSTIFFDKNITNTLENNKNLEERKSDFEVFGTVSENLFAILFELKNKKNTEDSLDISKIHITKKLLDLIMEDNYQYCLQEILKNGLPKLFHNEDYKEICKIMEKIQKTGETEEVFLCSVESKLRKFKMNLKEKMFNEEKKTCKFVLVYFEKIDEIDNIEEDIVKHEKFEGLCAEIEEFYMEFYPKKTESVKEIIKKTNIVRKVGYRKIIN